MWPGPGNPIPVSRSRWPGPGGPVPVARCWARPLFLPWPGGPVPVPVPAQVWFWWPVARSRSRSRPVALMVVPGPSGPVPVARSRWPGPGGPVPVARSRWPGPDGRVPVPIKRITYAVWPASMSPGMDAQSLPGIWLFYAVLQTTGERQTILRGRNHYRTKTGAKRLPKPTA